MKKVLVALVLALMACGRESAESPPSSDTDAIEEATGEIELVVNTQQLVSLDRADVSSVRALLTGPDRPDSEIVYLGRQDGNWVGTLTGVAPGSGLTVHIQAFGHIGTLNYSGSRSGITVAPGVRQIVEILLTQNGNTAFQNEAPLVDSVTASGKRVEPGGKVQFKVSARDPNFPRDQVASYEWSASSGSFDPPNAAETTWTAGEPGQVVFNIRVTDGWGLVTSINLQLMVEVTASPAPGEVALVVSVNQPPVISRVTTSRGYGVMGAVDNGIDELVVESYDPEGDALSYQWSSNCAGTFLAPTQANTRFTRTGDIPAQGCVFTATVADSRGSSSQGYLTLQAEQLVPVYVTPRVTAVSQSKVNVVPGDEVLLRVEASWYEGSLIDNLSFQWLKTFEAPLTTLVSDSWHSEARLVVPSTCPGSTFEVRARVSGSPSGLSTEHVFSFNCTP